MKFKINSKLYAKDQLYGTTTLGARGQVVIPAAARADLHLRPGDQLLVMGKFGKVLGLVKADALAEFMETIMKHLAGSGMEKQAKKHFEKLLNNLKK